MSVAVLMGGPSLERPISLLSGAEVLRDLIGRGHSAVPVILEPGAQARIAPSPRGIAELERLLAAPETSEAFEAPCDLPSASLRLRALEVDCVFIALHGAPGEDGSLQAWCEWSGFAHTSSGPTASALALDKAAYKALLERAGLPTPSWALLTGGTATNDDETRSKILDDVGLPAVVKAVDQGSSFGIHIVRTEDELQSAIRACLELSPRVLVEAFVQGMELTCAVLANEGAAEAVTLPVVQIVPRHASWFDFESKYQDGGADELCPAPIDEELRDEVSRLAIEAHRLIDGHGLTRCDFMVGLDGPLILELNTIPGLTRASLAPKAAEAAGMGFSGLIDDMIERARVRGSRWSRTT